MSGNYKRNSFPVRQLFCCLLFHVSCFCVSLMEMRPRTCMKTGSVVSIDCPQLTIVFDSLQFAKAKSRSRHVNNVNVYLGSSLDFQSLPLALPLCSLPFLFSFGSIIFCFCGACLAHQLLVVENGSQ